MAVPLRRQSSVDMMVEHLGLKGFTEHELAAVKEALFSMGLTTTEILTEKEAIEELTKKGNLKSALVAAGVAEGRSAMLAVQVRQKICSSAAKIKTPAAVGRGELAATAAVIFVAFSMAAAPEPPVRMVALVLFFGMFAYKRSACLSILYWCSPACVAHGIWNRRAAIGGWMWWGLKQYLFWFSGFFILYYMFQTFRSGVKEAAKWDKTVTTGPNGRVTTTMRHRETGQTFTTEEFEDADERSGRNAAGGAAGAAPGTATGGQQPTTALTIDTWLHCQIGRREPQRSGEFHSRTRVDGREYKFVAHIDTGNSADTVMPARMFDVLFPLSPGSNTERPGLTYLGTTDIVGVTGHSQTLHKYGGMKVMFDGVRSRSGKRLVFTLDVTRSQGSSRDVPGTHGYHDFLVSNKDMKRLLDAHGHTIRVVRYEDFTARCKCGFYH